MGEDHAPFKDMGDEPVMDTVDGVALNPLLVMHADGFRCVDHEQFLHIASFTLLRYGERGVCSCVFALIKRIVCPFFADLTVMAAVSRKRTRGNFTQSKSIHDSSRIVHFLSKKGVVYHKAFCYNADDIKRMRPGKGDFVLNKVAFSTVVSVLGSLSMAGFLYFTRTHAMGAPVVMINHVVVNPNVPVQRATLRKFPFPFQAMLAIASDADHVTLRKFNVVHEFLNTKKDTMLGLGLGLDVSDSFFAYNGSDSPDIVDINHTPLRDEMTFFRGVSRQLYMGKILLRYMRAGWIDSFHSMGDYSRVDSTQTLFKRSQAEYAIAYLLKQGIHLTVTIDHGNQSNVANFGAYGYKDNPFFDYQQGANPYSPYYVADLLREIGVRFVWPDIYNGNFSMKSMLFPIHLQDGHTMWGFWRYTGRLVQGVIRGKLYNLRWETEWNPHDLYRQLSLRHLSELIRTHGYAIVAQHLEGNADAFVLPTSAIEALTRLAHFQDRGSILVARTSRLLMYNLVTQYLQFHTTYAKGVTTIDITRINDPVDGAWIPTLDQLHGVTFDVRDPNQVVLRVNGKLVPESWIKRSPHTIGVVWFAPDYTNYAIGS